MTPDTHTASDADALGDARVAVARLGAADYTARDGSDYAPRDGSDHAPGGGAAGEVGRALGRAAAMLGWGDAESPFGNAIPRGARVVVKPNWVMHVNQNAAGGMGPMITHASVVRAAVEAALRSGAAEVIVGDAPLQACDFAALLDAGGLGAWAEDLRRREPRFRGVRDFRRTVATFVGGVRVASENVQPEDRFVLFDLAAESLLEPVTDGSRFRVTCYDPRLMARTHAAGRHQYLVAREIVEADVVVNLPKLKTHMKAGLTCALKNLIGINGNKEYLPHHRRGGAGAGGDCYPGASPVKRALEYVLDRQNMAGSFAAGRAWRVAAEQLYRAARLTGDDLGIEGSWSGNDTIWRTCLDLNRVLLYGRADGTLAERPQRRVLNVVDAVVAGQGNGPLAPQPLALGLLLAGANAAAVDRVGAHLLGYDPERVPIVREAFAQFRWPLARFGGGDVALAGDLGAGRADELLGGARAEPPRVSYPVGWRAAAARPRGRGAHDGNDGATALTEEMI